MKSKLSTAILSAVVIGAGLACFAFHKEARAAQARFTSAQATAQAWRGKLAYARGSNARRIADKARLQGTLDAAVAAAGPGEDWDTPQSRQWRTSVMLASSRLGNASLFRQLHLAAGQIATFDKVTAAYLQRVQDIAATVIAKDLPYPDPAVKQIADANIDQYHQELRDALGADFYDAFIEHRRTAGVGALSNMIAGATLYSNEKLTEPQSQALTQILAKASSSYQSGQDAYIWDLNVNNVLPAAQTILTPTQFDALKTYLTSTYANKDLRQLVKSYQDAQ